MSRAPGLMVVGHDEIGPDYADALKSGASGSSPTWARCGRSASTTASSGPGTLYLAFCEALFRTRAIRDMQLVLGRPFEEPV